MKSKLPEGWHKTKLDKIVDIRRGASPRPIKKYISKTGIPWVKIADATASNSKYINKTKEFIVEEVKDKSVFIKAGTLILSNSATPGLPKFMGIDGCVHDGWLILSNFKDIESMFLYYTLLDIRRKLVNLSDGSVFKNLNIGIVSNFEVNLPSLAEQKVIANSLSNLDDKIEINNKIIENLESQAQAIFKNWFVDFEFSDKNGLPYKSNGGKMVESCLGMIPKGWEAGEINEFFNIGIGRTPPRKKIHYFSENKDDMTWVSIADLGKSGVFISHSKEQLTKQSFEDFNIRIVPENTVLMSFKLTIGRLAISDKELTTNEAIAHFINKDIDMTKYLYLYLKVFEFERLGNTSSIGTAINSTIVKKMPFLKPDKKTLDYMEDILDPIFSKIKSIEYQNQKLSELRDTLLPKLMSGELRIPLN